MQAIDSSVLFCPAAFDELYSAFVARGQGMIVLHAQWNVAFKKRFFEMIEKAFYLIIAFNYYIVVCVNVIETTCCLIIGWCV